MGWGEQLLTHLAGFTPGEERTFGQGFLSKATSTKCLSGSNLILTPLGIPRRNKIQPS